MKPRLLDLFCGAGGAAMGYYRAGFEVVGVDIKPQPHYPFEFHQADALTYPLDGFDAYHASPPCQRYSTITAYHGKQTVDSHPDLVPPTRAQLQTTGKPYVIENVKGSPLQNWTLLCGSMFGLGAKPLYDCKCGHSFPYDLGKYGCPNCEGENIARLRNTYQLRRHRWFETSWGFVFSPHSCCHTGQALAVYGHSGGKSHRDGIQFAGVSAWKEGMGIDWMTGDELAEAIPPAYTEYIGKYLIQALQEEKC